MTNAVTNSVMSEVSLEGLNFRFFTLGGVFLRFCSGAVTERKYSCLKMKNSCRKVFSLCPVESQVFINFYEILCVGKAESYAALKIRKNKMCMYKSLFVCDLFSLV